MVRPSAGSRDPVPHHKPSLLVMRCERAVGLWKLPCHAESAGQFATNNPLFYIEKAFIVNRS